MTTKAELEDAFTALADAMTASPSPKPYGTKGRWTQASVRAVAISREDAKWQALRATPAGATAARRDLDAAKDAVHDADFESAQGVQAALDLVETALGSTERVLG